jgi:hypothetical protein
VIYYLCMHIRKLAALAIPLYLLPGCSIPNVKPQAEPIRITYDREVVGECTRLGEVVGSAGHWYNSWAISNDDLTTGALNDLRNKALVIGADTIYIPSHTLIFKTSVTILGQAYRCKGDVDEPGPEHIR